MARLAILVLLVVCVAIIDAAPQPGGKKFPPNKHKPLSNEEKKKQPRFIHTAKHRGVVAIPESFDARTKWPKCQSIADIRNQGQCGTCWAVSSASVMSDRMCIASGGTIQDYVSATQIASCTDLTQSADDNCQAGGDPSNAYKQATLFGVCTGGNYGSKSGCQPYSVPPNGEIPLTCSKTCTNTAYGKTPAQDARLIDSYWTTYTGDQSTPDQIKANVAQMQADILTNGPITAAITCFSDFQTWTPAKGPYRGPGAGAENKGGHAIRIIGWSTKNGIPYWMVANSWGTDCGDKGIFWVEMGKNVVGIEGTISAPIVKIPNTCGALCDTAFDQVIKTNPTDPKSPIYAFQGNCSTQITIDANGKITPVGTPQPLSTQFVGAPSGPITKWMQSGGKLWIMNPSGAAGSCGPVTGSTKQSCGGGTASSGAGPVTMAGSDKIVYYNDASKNQFMFTFKGGSSSGSGVGIGTAITAKFNAVNSLTDIDGKKMLVCGTDKAGAPQCGTMTYGNFQWATQPAPLKSVATKC